MPPISTTTLPQTFIIPFDLWFSHWSSLPAACGKFSRHQDPFQHSRKSFIQAGELLVRVQLAPLVLSFRILLRFYWFTKRIEALVEVFTLICLFIFVVGQGFDFLSLCSGLETLFIFYFIYFYHTCTLCAYVSVGIGVPLRECGGQMKIFQELIFSTHHGFQEVGSCHQTCTVSDLTLCALLSEQ